MESTAAPYRGGDLPEHLEELVQFIVEAAVWSPSVHNTQPWWFSTRGPRVTLHADPERQLAVSDPDGREMLLSCGAALYTLRLAARYRGFDPAVSLFPDPDRPSLLADVRIERELPSTEECRRLFEQVRRRHTHRGAFRPDPLASSLLAALRENAYHEGAALRIVADPRARAALAALTETAEQVQRLNPAYVSEAARWAPAPGSPRQDGVHQHTYPRQAERTEPHFAMRDFARGQGWGHGGGADLGAGAAGVVALLATREDRRGDWLHAGQALQRVLLRATAADVSAAFHTQALEVPELRELIRNRFCDGAHPQMLIRLGIVRGGPERGPASVRRAVTDVVTPES